tara:strand:- start:3828 stop:4685 length:858 start_codon:yes stop_codon:yes gene_type:complete
MNEDRVLIAIATYKEVENLEKLIPKIRDFDKSSDILIVDDKSEDKTKEVISVLDKKLNIIQRPKKLGLGTAHILCMLYAIKNNYNFLLTMDADFSHDPSYIPDVIKLKGKNNFVIGSRFCEGGNSDYKGTKKVISYVANFLTRNILSINLKEITTYFRMYDIENLKKLPFNELDAQGYSLGVKIIWLLNLLKVDLLETPIHLQDRNMGKSKIPKFQIFVSAFDLIKIKLKDIFLGKKILLNKRKSYDLDNKCSHCNSNYFALLKNNIYRCLICLNEQIIKNDEQD